MTVTELIDLLLDQVEKEPESASYRVGCADVVYPEALHIDSVNGFVTLTRRVSDED